MARSPFRPSAGLGKRPRRTPLLELLESRDCPTNAVGTDLMWRTYDPQADLFRLHSNPNATIKIVLDFDGYTTSNTQWNIDNNNGQPFTTPAYSFDADRTTFSAVERQGIIDIWRAAAEDFAPFNVDVTTEDPGDAALARSGPGDTVYGERAVLGPESWANIITFPGGGRIGGIADFNFGDASEIMCFVFNGDISLGGAGNIRIAGQTVSHEIGHTLGMFHDGEPANPSYYGGHGTGNTGWGPIMGAPFSMPLSQWSRGEYPGANNQQDDLLDISRNNIPYHPDDYASTSAGTLVSLNQSGSTSLVTTHGVIEQTNDVDVFEVFAGRGTLDITVDPLYLGTFREANLDILAELRDSTGAVVATSNPIDELDAHITFDVTQRGQYFLHISGTGRAATANHPGYSDYGSLGNYRINGTVPPFNFSPVASADTTSLDEDASVTLGVVSNDTDRDGDPLAITAITQGTNGTVTMGANGSVTYTPNANYFGSDSFTYTISDGQADTSPSTATVTVTVNSVNDDPTAIDDVAAVDEDKFVILNVAQNDSIAPDFNEFLFISSVGTPQNGTVTDFGSVFLYKPNANFAGNDTFTYTVSDGNGGFATGTVTVTVSAVVDPPVAKPDFFVIKEDAVTTFNVLANDTNGPDASGPLSLHSFEQPSYGTITRVGDQLRYTPKANFFGSDAFLYRIQDTNGTIVAALARITVTEVNDVPVLGADYALLKDASSVLIDVLKNDTTAPDVNETLTIKSVSKPTSGQAVLEGGKIRYSTTSAVSGKATFTYTVVDSRGVSATQTVTVNIVQNNRAPVNTVPKQITVERNSAVDMYGAGRITVYDYDAAKKPILVTITATTGTLFIGNAAGVTLTGNRTKTITLRGDQTLINRALATMYYTSDRGAVSGKITVTTNDLGNTPGPAREDVDVINVVVINRAPDLVNATLTCSTKANTKLTVSAVSGAAKAYTDKDADALTYRRVNNFPVSGGTVVFNANGSFTFTPNTGFKGRVSFQVVAYDGFEATAKLVKPLTIVINVT